MAAAIQKAPRNEAPWRYLTGLFAVLQPWASTPRALSRCPEVRIPYVSIRHVSSTPRTHLKGGWRYSSILCGRCVRNTLNQYRTRNGHAT